MNTNCLTYYPYSKRYYLLHPWSFIAATGCNIKTAWQRITRGWSDRDTWNLNDYLLEILPEMVDYLREHTLGYPNNFEEPEQWDAFLKLEIINRLKNAREEQTILKNEYQEAFDAIPTRMENGHLILSDKEKSVLKKWASRQQEIFEWQKEELEKGLNAMGNVFWDLWN